MYEQLEDLIQILDEKAIKDPKTTELELTEIIAKLRDPEERYKAYCEVSKICFKHSIENWNRGNIKEAYRKLWSSAVLYVDCKLLSRGEGVPLTLREYWKNILELFSSSDEAVLQVWHNGLLSYFALILGFTEEKLFWHLVDILRNYIEVN